MDILSHTLTGTAVGTVVASYSKKPSQHLSIVLIGTFGGALPDFDAVSLWSKFDTTIGRYLNLSHSGKEIYFGKYWYSHHGALHSATIAVLIPLIVMSLMWFKRKKESPFTTILEVNKLYALSFFLGFIGHLLEDMPTPHCVWGGVRFLFPSSGYWGGTGDIWWWNNYDLFLIIISTIIINVILLVIGLYSKKRVYWYTLGVFVVAVILFFTQVKSRTVSYQYTGHTSSYHQLEKQSKAEQKRILGPRVYQWMEDLDNSIPLHF